MQINKFFFFTLILIAFSLNTYSNDRGFFPFGFYDDIQDKGKLSLILNYGFLDFPLIYICNRDDGSFSPYIGNEKIQYGLFKWLTISFQHYYYEYYEYQYNDYVDHFVSKKYPMSGFFLDLFISWSKTFYSTLRIINYDLGAYEPYRFSSLLFIYGLNLGVKIVNNNRLKIIGELALGYWYFRFQFGVNINILKNMDIFIDSTLDMAGIFLISGISYKILNNVRLALGLSYSSDRLYEADEEMKRFIASLRWSIL